jgi:hypothetical protein
LSLPIKIAALVATAVVAGVIAFAFTGAEAAAPSQPQAWIDDPLHGEVVAPGPVAIVAHAFDPAGVSEMVLYVDGQEEETTVPDESGEELVDVEWSWIPPSEDIFVLEVEGVGPDGQGGIRGRAVIEVRSPASPADPSGPTFTTTTVPGSTTTTLGVSTTTLEDTTTTTGSGAATTTTRPPSPTTTKPAATTTSTTTTTTQPPPCTPPNPILKEPVDNAQVFGPGPQVTLEWSGWRGTPPACPASGYLIQIATSSTFGSVVASTEVGAGTTQWSPPASAWPCNVTRYWRVISLKSNGGNGGVSATWRINVVCIG